MLKARQQLLATEQASVSVQTWIDTTLQPRQAPGNIESHCILS